jgi:acyl carrier protein
MTVDTLEYQELADWLTVKIAGYLNVPREMIDLDTPLADCGIDSVSAMTLCADLQCETGFDVETTVVYDYVTIDGIAAYLTAEQVVP